MKKKKHEVTRMIDVQRAAGTALSPDDAMLARAANATLAYCARAGSLTLRLVEREEMRALNHQFRGKSDVTNVLSFPAGVVDEDGVMLWGDVLMCAPVVENEAQEQGKDTHAHYLHMVVHGTLHLLGYDHIQDDEAQIMEQGERDILASLGFNNPYASQDSAALSSTPVRRTALDG